MMCFKSFRFFLAFCPQILFPLPDRPLRRHIFRIIKIISFIFSDNIFSAQCPIKQDRFQKIIFEITLFLPPQRVSQNSNAITYLIPDAKSYTAVCQKGCSFSKKNHEPKKRIFSVTGNRIASDLLFSTPDFFDQNLKFSLLIFLQDLPGSKSGKIFSPVSRWIFSPISSIK